MTKVTTHSHRHCSRCDNLVCSYIGLRIAKTDNAKHYNITVQIANYHFLTCYVATCYLPLNILPPQYLTRVRLLYSSDSASLNKLMPYISILILCIAPLLVLGYDFILSPLSQNAKYPSRHEDSSHSDSQVAPLSHTK